MRREYEALSKLIGKNYAVLEDGTSVYLTPNGEVRDADNKILLPAFEGRADLYRRNDKGEVRAEAKFYQNMITDEAGNPIWSDYPIVAKTVRVTHHGDFSKGAVDSPGSGGTTFLNGIFRYTKVSDLVPSMEQLFADDTSIKLYHSTTGNRMEDPEDVKYVLDGAYGRGSMTLYAKAGGKCHGTEDGYLPLVLVVPESYKVECGPKSTPNSLYDCYEPGIYMCAGSLGKKAGSPVLTYRDKVEITYPLKPELLAGPYIAKNQMLVTDAEGVAKWEDRTHYDAVEEGEILPEQTFTIGTEGAALLTDPLAAALTLGETYTVWWNGATYEVIAQLLEEDGESIGTAIGNVDRANGVGDTGEPFVIVEFLEEQVEAMNGIRVQIIPLDGATAVTAKIIGKVKVVHKLDSKYLPEGVAPTPITFTLAADGTFTSDTPFVTVYEKDERTLARSIRVVRPAGLAIDDGTEISTESYYAVSNVSKCNSYMGTPCIRCEIATYADVGENNVAPVKLEIVWHYIDDGNGGYTIWKKLPNLPVVSVNDTKDHTLFYHGAAKRWKVNTNHKVDIDGNGWFAGTVEGTALILPSPDGSRWQITVDDTGALSTAKL